MTRRLAQIACLAERISVSLLLGSYEIEQAQWPWLWIQRRKKKKNKTKNLSAIYFKLSKLMLIYLAMPCHYKRYFCLIAYSTIWRHLSSFYPTFAHKSYLAAAWQETIQGNLTNHGVDGCWVKIWLDGWDQSVELNPAGSWPQGVFPRVSIMGQSCLTSLLMIWTRGSSASSASLQVPPTWVGCLPTGG